MSVVLLTLDTTRADHVGAYQASDRGPDETSGPTPGAPGGGAEPAVPPAATPNLDALAVRGTRYARALTAAPLTLPAHASLLTGLDPPAHGLVDNGIAALGEGVPTLATVLSARGYATGAFLASRVLDRRFGLARSFDVYDDRMAAERVGEYGYPERDAAEVTSAAIAWLSGVPAGRPYLVWVHYYDPHSPYTPPAEFRGGTPERDYAGEIAYVDREIGRLLAALPGPPGRRVVAAVGDHGEALGEHGERAHGIFLYRASLEVPLILAGAGVPAGATVTEAVAIRRLAPTLAALAGVSGGAGGKGKSGTGGALEATGPVLPGLPVLAAGGRPPPAEPIYSETQLPATAYGWSPLKAMSDSRYRLIVAPRPELYDYVADPGETHNLIGERRDEARRLKRALDAHDAALVRHPAATPEADPQLAAELRSLGYLSGVSAKPGRGGGGDAIDPKDGIALLAELDRAKALIGERPAEAASRLADLVRKNPGNVPFLTQLGHARLAAGDGEGAIAAYRRAITLNPGLDFLHLNLAGAYRRLGRTDDARRELKLTLDLNPRAAGAWFSLAEMAHQAGDGAEERRLLLAAVDAGTASAAVLLRLGQVETLAGRIEAGDGYFRRATELVPDWPGPWILWGELAENGGRLGDAVARFRSAVEVDPANPVVLLHLGRALAKSGETAEARPYLERARALGAGTPTAAEADRLLRPR